MGKFASITNVRISVMSCTKCELCKTRTHAVPGHGSDKARIMFIGEAPGRNEDAQGRPFVGAAGRILDTALEGAGISRDTVYITNTVKCRPPNNSVPTDAYRAACADYLKAEIKLIAPRIVCIMGNTAYSSILGGSGGITRDRGRTIHHEGVDYFLSVHPAAVIYNPSLADVLARDIKKLAKIAEAS